MDTSEQQQQTQYPYQQQQPPSSSYDPSQSYEAYYAYHHHHQYYDPSSYPQQHYHQYYDPSSYPHQLYYDHSSTQAYPPPTQIHNPPEQQPPVENPAAAAAMEALSQLSQFAGDMDAAEKAGMAYNPHHYPQHYSMEHGYVSIQPGGSGRGRRGGGPFRGGGRRGGGAGRGRGRGGGRKPHQSAASSPPAPTASVPTPAPPAPVLPVAWCDICRVECNSLEILEQHKNGKRHKKTAQRFEEIQKKQKLLAEYQAKSIPDAILPSAVTETAADVVEAEKVSAEPEIIPTAAGLSTQVGEPAKASATDDHHATGISMQVGEQAKASATDVHHAAGISMQVGEQAKASATDDHHAASISMQVGEQAKASATDDHYAAGISMQVGEQAKASATDDNNAQLDGAIKTYNAETEQNSESKGADIEGSTGPPGTRGGYNRFNRNRGGGMKRNIIRYGRGGKRLKSFEPVPRRVPERQRVCTLCNVMCETLAVFDTHIAGKKHISKMKRCQGPGSVYGPITVYIPPNQPSAYPTTQGQEPVFYGLKSREIIHQHTTYMGMGGLHAENYPLHQGIQFVQNRNAEGGVSEQQVMQGLETTQGKEVTANTGPQDPANAPLVFESKKPNPSDGSA